MKISVTVVARDAEHFIGTCLASVGKIADDIVVVVDDRTIDNTVQIAKEFTEHIFIRKFENFSDQKNFAASQAKHDWILSLDADETATPGLCSVIRGLPDRPLFQAYFISRKNKIFGKYINHTNWDPFGILRFYNRNFCSWEGEIHEQVVTEKNIGHIYDYIYHDNYRTVNEFMTRQDYYSTMEAEKLFSRGTKFTMGQLFGQPAVDFGRRYILHAGFMDGWHGLYLSYLMVIYHFSVWIKLWQKYQKVSS